MAIRYTCDKCGSVMKIKEDRIGKEGHCPKCKAAFIVPAADSAPGPDSPAEPQLAAVAPAPRTDAQPVAAPAPAVNDEDFDPVAFLMTDGPSKSGPAGAKRAAPAAAADAPDMRVKRAAGPADYSASDEPDVRVGAPRTSTAEDDEELEAQLLKRKPKRPAAPPSAAQSADEMLRVNAASSAKELMTKTVEESRIRAAQMPEERKKPQIDYGATARELLLRFAPAVGGTVLLIVVAYFLGNLIAGGGVKLPDLGRVSGTVTKGNEPLVDAKVSFSPVDVKFGAATAYTDENGYYELNYMEGVKGAVLGKNKIEVSLIGKDGREVVPPLTPYGFGSNETVIVEEGSQTVDIKIP